VFAFAIGGLLVARWLLVPDTFGDRGHYRAAAVDSIMAHPRQYAGHQECSVCHSDIQAARLASNHQGVRCEACHGPAAAHVAAPMDVQPEVPRGRELCTLCHGFNPSRPTGFPQVDAVAHNPRTPCTACHDAHAPEPPVLPEDCSACHGQIARQKAVSHHATLECQTCHQAPDEHKQNPRSVRPSKPTERAFCGACHSQASLAASVPQVDLRSHGQPYVCWQCHYPHQPEAGE
jgi:hypothetical protein